MAPIRLKFGANNGPGKVMYDWTRDTHSRMTPLSKERFELSIQGKRESAMIMKCTSISYSRRRLNAAVVLCHTYCFVPTDSLPWRKWLRWKENWQNTNAAPTSGKEQMANKWLWTKKLTNTSTTFSCCALKVKPGMFCSCACVVCRFLFLNTGMYVVDKNKYGNHNGSF